MAGISAEVALLGGILDYAGTFPPAKLSRADALAEMAAFRHTARNPWLVGRMAMAATDLLTLTPAEFLGQKADGSPALLVALGSEAPAGQAAAVVEREVRELAAHTERSSGAPCRLITVAYETRALRADFSNVAQIQACLAPFPVGSLIAPCFEIALDGRWGEALVNGAQEMSRLYNSGKAARVAIKVRTGGASVPGPDMLAEVLVLVARNGLRFKATQGLHRAVTLGKETGFVNLFAACALAYRPERPARAEEVRRCLEDDDPAAFRFSSTFSWRDLKLTVEEILGARAVHQATFGSCSAKEPDEHLSLLLKGKKR